MKAEATTRRIHALTALWVALQERKEEQAATQVLEQLLELLLDSVNKGETK